MKCRFFLVFLALGLLGSPARSHAATALSRDLAGDPAPSSGDHSLRQEIQAGIDRGLAWLREHQHPEGWWSTPDHPAMTGLAVSALLGDPRERTRSQAPAVLTRAYAYLLASVQPDGSIHRGTLINYNTAITTTALALAGDPAHDTVLRRAREYLVRSQNDFGEPGKLDTPLDGGVGYGDKYRHADLNNTLTALEALRFTRHLVTDRDGPPAPDLNWAAAIHFIQSCQNLPSHNAQPWVSDDPKDRGGFVYFPGHSMAGGVTNAVTGKVSLRSYGSISYAGLLSYLYAQLGPEDPRVVAVLDWLQTHYTLDENPGLGQEGLYYYLHLLTKALNAAGVDHLNLPDGRRVDWRREVALRLLNLQQRDGSWANENNRWWEKDPNLVTAYAVLSLEMLWRRL